MNKNGYDLSPMGILLCDSYRLRFNFIDACVMYTPQVCNKPARLSVGLAPDNPSMWMSNYPRCVTRLVTGDSAVS